MTANSKPCNCQSCAGEACQCGCQGNEDAARTACSGCEGDCKCGPSCSCRKP